MTQISPFPEVMNGQLTLTRQTSWTYFLHLRIPTNEQLLYNLNTKRTWNKVVLTPSAKKEISFARKDLAMFSMKKWRFSFSTLMSLIIIFLIVGVAGDAVHEEDSDQSKDKVT